MASLQPSETAHANASIEKMFRLSALLLLGLCAGAQAEISYTVYVQPDKNNLHVKIEIPKTSSGATVQIANWGPGSYRYVDNYKNVQNFTAKDGSGNTLTFANDTAMPNTWKVSPAETTVVEYDMANTAMDGGIHWSGPATYMYVADRKTEPCSLTVQAPNGWQSYTGLNGANNKFEASDFDVLADNPVSIGDLIVDTYVSRGKMHYIVMRGKARKDVDRAYLTKACKFVTDMESDFFGGTVPYDHYVWHFAVNDSGDGAGGLEHLASTEISLSSGVGYRAVGVLAHEFFHLWNVKRIRSSALGPFDYTQLPQTGALWWLEGVTDYFSHYLLYRYGWYDKAQLYKDILSNLNTVRNNPARLEVSAYDASYRVREAANGRGNSDGYRISYYSLGWICGMELDLEMRDHTAGRHSLDDVEHALWDMCKDNQPGFPEDQIRTELQRFGGYSMGPFYDNVIRKPGEVIVEQQLAKIGLSIAENDEQFTDVGFIGTGTPDKGLTVQRTSPPGADQLRSGDVITKINDVTFTGTRRAIGKAYADLEPKLKVGTPFTVTFMRSDQTMTATITPVQSTRKAKSIVEDKNATPAQLARREEWMKVKKPR